MQLGKVMQALGLGDVYSGRTMVKVTAGSGAVTAHGSVIDNRTQAPTFVPGQ